MASTSARWILTAAALSALALAANACGSSSDNSGNGDGDPDGGSETGGAGNGGGAGGGSSSGGASGLDGGSTGGVGSGAGGLNTGDGGMTGGNTGPTGGPRFPGAGETAGYPLLPGFGPDTADDCPPGGGVGPTDTEVVRPPATLCFYGEDKEIPAASIEQVIETVDDVEVVHLRVTFDPRFADNTFGTNAMGWGEKGHTWKDLVGSDHVELLFTDCSGDTVMQFKLDYITQDPDSPSGYGTLGVSGGDGKMLLGDASAVLAAATSLDRNLNGCGYDTYTVDSPATDENYTPNPDTPNWDYRVQYEVWLDASAFDECFGQAYIESVHASPSKLGTNTIEVTGDPCPPEWDEPYCQESLAGEGAGCGSQTPDGGAPPPCPHNFTPYEACPTECVPVPFAGYPDRAACPDGYVLEIESEGRYCVPELGNVCG